MAQYFYGEDTYRARQAIGERAQRDAATIRWLGREELTERPLSAWAGQRQSLFGTELLVVTDPSRLSQALQEAVVPATKALADLNVIFWDRGMPDKRSLVWRRCRALAEQFSYLADQAIASWLVREATQRGGTLLPDAAATLVQRVGRDGWRLLSELEKLLVLSNTVTVAQLPDDLTVEGADSVFALLDALMVGNRPQVIATCEQLLQQGHGELYLLAMLGYQFRTLLVIDHYHHEAPEKIAAATALHPFVIEKGLRHIRRLSTAWLLDTLTRILATDFAIKQGKVEAKTALILLLWHLADQLQARQMSTSAVGQRQG